MAKPAADVDISNLVDGQGRIEFVARSIDGKSICGVTAEEHDYWIVSIKLSEGSISGDSRRAMENEFGRRVATGDSLKSILEYVKSTEATAVNKMQIMRLLNEACGIPAMESRELLSLMDQSLEPLVVPADLERKWRALVAKRARPFSAGS
ncbi:hypothetical protein [Nocardia huaxiensis]|uniref:hypothetical protein n=1 Tax=Nocardia huaxiensis TaxID=2755382 RepID=UPI001E5DFF0B|nr:hypothetical protein [Nocardia huaxiensis]UFS96291.1 hypothetical protein LPY97_37640 [Nocardia huaxiensis]